MDGDHYTRRFGAMRHLAGAMALAFVLATPAFAEEEPAPTPAALTELLSCRSREMLDTFGEALFLRNRPPAWMRPSELPKALDGMIGLFGFAVEGQVAVFGEPVDHVYFMKEWVVALLPRASAERVIRAQKMERAPIAITEQYYRFVDPEAGPMIGAFAPTGNALARMFGEETPPAHPEMLLVGCNYAAASQADFLAAARGAEEMMRKAQADFRRMVEQGEPAK